MPPRRSHKKSRAGCHRCKSRKIKCDEARPRCYNCEKHGAFCDFGLPSQGSERAAQNSRSLVVTSPQPLPDAPGSPYLSRSGNISESSNLPTFLFSRVPSGPSSPLSIPSVSTTSSADSRLLELRLLHHYCTSTCKTLSFADPLTDVIWRENVPKLAFAAASGSASAGSSHLTDAVLAVAALHLRSLCPSDLEIIRASHAYMASSLREYNRLLQEGITSLNAEALFLNSALIAFQSTATRVLTTDEPSFDAAHMPPRMGAQNNISGNSWKDASGSVSDRSLSGDSALVTIPEDTTLPVSGNGNGNRTDYSIPMTLFHAFQGVKAITAASWPYLRHSDVVLPIINSQPAFHLDIACAHEGFFGHLLDDLDDELASTSSGGEESIAINAKATAGSLHTSNKNMTGNNTNTNGSSSSIGPSPHTPGVQHPDQNIFKVQEADGVSLTSRTRHAYRHAVAVLNWAHGNTHNAACLAFPATVSRRFVELIAARTPRAISILACFFAMLKTLDSVWWLRGMARREVLGVLSLLDSEHIPPEVEQKWRLHLQWPLKIALYQDEDGAINYIPPDIWGAASPTSCNVEDNAKVQATNQHETTLHDGSMVSHIDLITETISNDGGLSAEFNCPVPV